METWMERGVDTMFLCFIKSEVLFMGITCLTCFTTYIGRDEG